MGSPLDCFSEPFPPHGALAAEGAENLLGRPRLDPLTVLVREAVQNSWDARRRDGVAGEPVGFDVRGSSASPAQIGVLRDEVFAGAPGAAGRLREVLHRGDVLLLGLTDSGTTGLGGPVRADRPAHAGEATDFVDLVFNIGQPSDRAFGGGSYGFGKTIAYVVSEARAVLIYTRTDHAGARQSRFMAAGFSDHFARGAQLFTGRHWWGRQLQESIEPVVGAEADALAAAVGLVPFGDTACGTTIAVVAPDLRGRSPMQTMRYLADAITWNFWPKMVASSADGTNPAMAFSVELDGEAVEVAHPDHVPPLAAYAEALRAVRQAERDGLPRASSPATVSELRSVTPDRRLGWLAMTRSPVAPRSLRDVGVDEVAGLGLADSFEGLSHHIALVRQPELVVDYFEGPELPLLDTEWAGVFKADADLDAAFAAAEPPTHDGWEPSLVSAGPARRWVLSTLLALRDAAVEFAVPHPEALGDGRRSAALVAEALGGLLEHEPTAEFPIPPEPPDAVVFTSLALAPAEAAERRLTEVGFAVDPFLQPPSGAGSVRSGAGRVSSNGDAAGGAEGRVLDAVAELAAGPDGRASAGEVTRRAEADVLGFVDADQVWAVEGAALRVDASAARRWWLQVESPIDAAIAVEPHSRPAGDRLSRLLVQPHWTAAAVQAAPWKLLVHGVSHPAGGQLHGWDYETPVDVETTVRVDLDRVRAECALGETDTVVLVGSWLASSTNTRRRGDLVPITESGDHRLRFAIEPGDAGGRLRVERRLVLLGDGTSADRFGARAPGSVLWTDRPVVTLLEVDVARFPTEAVDFDGPPVDLPGAAWWLDARFDDLDASPHHAVRLFVNAEHPALEPVLSGSTETIAATIRSVLRWQVTRALLAGALDNDEFVARASGRSSTGFEAGTLGSSLRRLLERHFPGRRADTMQRLFHTDPSRFDAQLQARVDLWEAVAP